MKKLDLVLIGGGTLGLVLIGRAYFRAQEEKERRVLRALGNAAAEAERQRLAALEAERQRNFPPPGPVVPPPSPPRLVQVQGPLVVVPGHRYLANIETNGVVNAAASVSAIQSRAQREGFTDVVVSKQTPPGWPSTAGGDYFLSGTYAGTNPKGFPRTTSVFMGSVKVLDAWEMLPPTAHA